ncbi:hypothetical protein B6V74_07800 [Thioclava sp. F42-5]|uniref:DUF2783 domain-containing protein n=1 Tax=Thioclava sp. F42-5 TaxID=1973005 RepID=UPI000B546BAC|nr:DUF2783 domain-containing protein [Thioclava sp. F42-5]OWY09905.1 hypothetical protein B6V74_07800 [Thioclava sp. F42-5]
MTPEQLETIYEALATQLDAIPQPQRELFLAKLVLLQAHEAADPDTTLRQIAEAARDLDD